MSKQQDNKKYSGRYRVFTHPKGLKSPTEKPEANTLNETLISVEGLQQVSKEMEETWQTQNRLIRENAEGEAASYILETSHTVEEGLKRAEENFEILMSNARMKFERLG